MLEDVIQILLLEKMRREEGITEAQALLLETLYKKIGYKATTNI